MCWCRTMPNISLNEKTSTWYCYLNAKRNRWQVVSELSGYKLTLSFSCREFLQENTKGLAACFLWAESWGLWASGRGGELSLYKFTVYSFVLFWSAYYLLKNWKSWWYQNIVDFEIGQMEVISLGLALTNYFTTFSSLFYCSSRCTIPVLWVQDDTWKSWSVRASFFPARNYENLKVPCTGNRWQFARPTPQRTVRPDHRQISHKWIEQYFYYVLESNVY